MKLLLKKGEILDSFLVLTCSTVQCLSRLVLKSYKIPYLKYFGFIVCICLDKQIDGSNGLREIERSRLMLSEIGMLWNV